MQDRARRLRQEAAAVREIAVTLSSDDDRELFLRHAAAMETEAARLDLQAEQAQAGESEVLG